jgi:probable H4MPT-linked C1 transfer pathway protein
LATFANRWIRSWPALLLDVGSTTTDVIPLGPSGPCAAGRTDTERLANSELVYTGVERTPICAIVNELPWKDRRCPVASELFATTSDAYILLGNLPEHPNCLESADGRPRIRPAAHARMARMICADVTLYDVDEAMAAARLVQEAQLSALKQAVMKVAARLDEMPRTLLLSGHGEFLLRRLVQRLPWPCQTLSLSGKLGPQVSRCAPAHALAVLAGETLERTS